MPDKSFETAEIPRKPLRIPASLRLMCGLGVMVVCIIPCLCGGGFLLMATLAQSNEISKTQTTSLAVAPDTTVLTLEVVNPFGVVEFEESSERDQHDIRVEVRRVGWGLTGGAAQENFDETTVAVETIAGGYRLNVKTVEPSFSSWGVGFADVRVIVPRQRGVANPILYNLIVNNDFGAITVNRLQIAERLDLKTQFGAIDFSGGLTHPQGDYQLRSQWGNIRVDVTPRSVFQYAVTGQRVQVQLSADATSNTRQTDDSAFGYYNDPQTQAYLQVDSQYGEVILQD